MRSTIKTRSGPRAERSDRNDHRQSPIQHEDRSFSPLHERERPISKSDPRRDALLALRARLSGNASQMANATLSGRGNVAAGPAGDTADQASDSFEQDLAVSLLGNAQGALVEIEAALTRLEEGTYGECQRCGVKIPNARLEAIPYTPYCVQCAARNERRQAGR